MTNRSLCRLDEHTMFKIKDGYGMTHPSDPTQRVPVGPLRRTRLARWSIGMGLLLMTLVVSPTSGANDLTLSVNGSNSVGVGEVITLTLDVTGLTVPINGIQAFVQYDPNVLRFVGTEENTDIGTGWKSITDDRGSGELLQILVMLGGETSIDHAAATLTFQAIALGSTSVSFLPDAPPRRAKLTAAVDAAPMVPVTLGSEAITVVPSNIPTVSQWGLAAMALLLLTLGTFVLRRLQPARG